jgi:hypothetical protein
VFFKFSAGTGRSVSKIVAVAHTTLNHCLRLKCKRNSSEFQFWSLPELRNEGETIVPAFEWSVCSGFQFAQGHEALSGVYEPADLECGVVQISGIVNEISQNFNFDHCAGQGPTGTEKRG